MDPRLEMPTGLATGLRFFDISMLCYWAVMLCVCAGLFALPDAIMYSGYGTPFLDNWNWSFAPLDIVFAVTGLISLRMAKKGDPRWRALAIISLTLMLCAGLMAVSYWFFAADYNISWWAANIALIIPALIWLPQLINLDAT